MSEDYQKIRKEAIAVLDKLVAVHAEYKRIATTADGGGQQALLDLIGREEFALREGIEALGNDPRFQTVLSAEYPLLARSNAVAHFWMWLRENKLVDVGEQQERERQEAQTMLPPEPNEEITGVAVRDYMVDLSTWIKCASRDLWGDDNPMELPALGNHYGIGNFGTTIMIANILTEGAGLRAHWIQIAACGAYWDTVGIGSARAKLIYKGAGVLEQLLHPPS